MLFGSYMGNWDGQDDLLRSVLATPTMGLACMMVGEPHWFVHHMGLGETIGYGTRLTAQQLPLRSIKAPANGTFMPRGLYQSSHGRSQPAPGPDIYIRPLLPACHDPGRTNGQTRIASDCRNSRLRSRLLGYNVYLSAPQSCWPLFPGSTAR